MLHRNQNDSFVLPIHRYHIAIHKISAGDASLLLQATPATDAAPGVGKNFTYTLRKNNADTAMVATQSGNAAFTAEGSGAITLAKFDSISIKLVIDAAAGTPIPRYSIKLDN